MSKFIKGPALTSLALCGFIAGPASAASDLIISEYIEGSSNNKALEIFNGTGGDIDLAPYEIQYFFNGNTSAGFTFNLSGNLADGEVFVLANSNANADILSKADATSGSGFFNGDDAVVLLKGGVIVDAIGQIGVDPGSTWGSSPTTTANATLRRKSSVSEPDSDAFDAFDPAIEWDGFDTDNSDDLGTYGGGDGGDGSDGGDNGPTLDCAADATLISAIQGSGNSSPLVDQSVQVQAVVTGLRNDGFFLQEEDEDSDGNPQTSEGIFVSSSEFPVIGEQVRVAGQVNEFFGLTRLLSEDWVSCSASATLPSVSFIELPLPAGSELEQFEGMRIQVQDLIVTDINNLWRFGEVVLGPELRRQPSDVAAPLSAEYNAVEVANARNRLFIEDGTSARFPSQLSFYPQFSYATPIRVGDQLSATGPLNFAFGEYRINPESPLQVNDNRPLSPVLVDGNLRIASFNVLNYFNGEVQADGSVSFDYDANRGADNAEAFALQEARIVEAIRGVDADVLGLMELENDGFASDSAIQALVDAVNATLSESEAYTFIASANGTPIGTDAITVGMLYRAAVVTPVDESQEIPMPVQDLQNGDTQQMRTALLQSFRHNESGVEFAAVVNHFKSKGSECFEDQNSPSATDSIQGSCNALRVSAAVTLGEAMESAELPERRFILGDLNAYSAEDPMAVLTEYSPEERGYTIQTAVNTAADGGSSVPVAKTYGYRNLGKEFEPEGFSYWFFGNGLVGSLDHVLASPKALEDVVDATHWQINSVEAYQLQYDQALRFYPDAEGYAFTDVGPYRSSDHDPLVVSLLLQADRIPGDFNGDGKRNFRDFKLLLKNLFKKVTPKREVYDLNQDGRISFLDVWAYLRLR